jgi:hypothetical protein
MLSDRLISSAAYGVTGERLTAWNRMCPSDRRVTVHSGHIGNTFRPLRETQNAVAGVTRWTSGCGLWPGCWKARRWPCCAGSSRARARFRRTRDAASRLPTRSHFAPVEAAVVLVSLVLNRRRPLSRKITSCAGLARVSAGHNHKGAHSHGCGEQFQVHISLVCRRQRRWCWCCCTNRPLACG